MRSRKNSLICFFGCLFLISAGCKTQQQVETAPVKKRSSSYLLERLAEHELAYDWFSARASTNANIGDKQVEITMKIRIRRDSAIWISISPALGIEVARVVVTQDSLMFMNRLEKNYFYGSIDYLDTLSPISINFEMLQALITGNNMVFYEEEESDKPDRYRVDIEEGMYLLSTLGKRKYKRTVKGKKSADETVNRIWLQPVTYKITRSEIIDFQNDHALTASYDQFESIQGQAFPHLVNIGLQAEREVSVEISYSKVTLNNPAGMPFKIPDKYEPVE